MSALRVSGVRLDALLAMKPGEIINAVPESEQPNYRYWRAAHLGKLALNLLRGRMVINAGENDRLIHFSQLYDDGPRIAANIASGHSTSQWSAQDARRFAKLTGVPAPDRFGAVVLAARYIGGWPTSKYDPGWGCSVEAAVGFHEIDPHSLGALEELFDVDLLAQPDVVSPDFPLAPAPARGPIIPASADRPHADWWYMPGQRPLRAA